MGKMFDEFMEKLKQNSTRKFCDYINFRGVSIGFSDSNGKELKVGDCAELKMPYMKGYSAKGFITDWNQRLVLMNYDDTRYDITPEDSKYLTFIKR